VEALALNVSKIILESLISEVFGALIEILFRAMLLFVRSNWDQRYLGTWLVLWCYVIYDRRADAHNEVTHR